MPLDPKKLDNALFKADLLNEKVGQFDLGRADAKFGKQMGEGYYYDLSVKRGTQRFTTSCQAGSEKEAIKETAKRHGVSEDDVRVVGKGYSNGRSDTLGRADALDDRAKKEGWRDTGSAGGFSVGDTVKVRDDTGLDKERGDVVKYVNPSGNLVLLKDGRVFAAHHLKK